ncbi:MAG: hypothetical protein MRQ13_01080 [Candidatus Midichloria sp.]|nr:hypothetical protein [Candidatus Midichloria sp.]
MIVGLVGVVQVVVEAVVVGAKASLRLMHIPHILVSCIKFAIWISN